MRTRKNRETGTWISMGRAEEFGLNPKDGGAWCTECDKHGNNVQHETRALAESWSAEPSMWCADCQRIAAHG